nr:TadE/TadG family type IV pilus assembly protein [Pilimelia terevasa]
MRGAGRERGSVTIETAILAVVLLLLILLAVAAGRTVLAASAVADAAHDAARAASLQTDPPTARQAADRAAHRSLSGNGLQCQSVNTSVDTTGFTAPLGQPAQVRVEVGCTLSYAKLAALPGLTATKMLRQEFTSPLDRYRTRTVTP